MKLNPPNAHRSKFAKRGKRKMCSFGSCQTRFEFLSQFGKVRNAFECFVTQVQMWLPKTKRVWPMKINVICTILIQLTISGFAWFTAFRYLFLFNFRHYKCFYCKSNLSNRFLMPDLYEKVALFVFLYHLVQTLWKLLTFAIRVWRNPRCRQMNPMGH